MIFSSFWVLWQAKNKHHSTHKAKFYSESFIGAWLKEKQKSIHLCLYSLTYIACQISVRHPCVVCATTRRYNYKKQQTSRSFTANLSKYTFRHIKRKNASSCHGSRRNYWPFIWLIREKLTAKTVRPSTEHSNGKLRLPKNLSLCNNQT
jgi:hypothetical protein